PYTLPTLLLSFFFYHAPPPTELSTLSLHDALPISKSVLEIHQTLEGPAPDAGRARPRVQLLAVIVQIGLIDIVFSLDSVFTAVGLVRELPVMVAAIVVAILVMMWVSGSISAFISRYPTIKML